MSTYGRYHIVEKLGSGGMGEVYRAFALGVDGFRKPVVIKRIQPQWASNRDLAQRFINEAKIAMTLLHGNVVQVLDLGRLDDEYFMALEFVEGRDLQQVLTRCSESGQWPSLELSVYIIVQVLRGIDYAHRRVKGMVHRDIKPANVLCSFEGEVKISDFGIARTSLLHGLTTEGDLHGSVKFMSPEQARGEAVDQRSDLFSLGVTLYQLLCRRHPFEAAGLEEMLRRVRHGQFLTPAERGVALPAELASVLLRAMAPDRDARFPTASTMLGALESFQRSACSAGASDLRALLLTLYDLDASSADSDSDDQLVGTELSVRVPTGHDVAVASVERGRVLDPTPTVPSRRPRAPVTLAHATTALDVRPAPDAAVVAPPVEAAAAAAPDAPEPCAAEAHPVAPHEEKVARRRGRLLAVVAGVLFLAAVAGALAVGLSPTPPRASALPPPATPDARPRATRVAQVTISVRALPGSAAVFLDGLRRANPFRVQQPARPGRAELLVSAPGHQPQRRWISLAAGGDFTVVLVPESRGPASAPAAAPPLVRTKRPTRAPAARVHKPATPEPRAAHPHPDPGTLSDTDVLSNPY